MITLLILLLIDSIVHPLHSVVAVVSVKVCFFVNSISRMQGGYIPSEQNSVWIGADHYTYSNPGVYESIMYSVMEPWILDCTILGTGLSCLHAFCAMLHFSVHYPDYGSALWMFSSLIACKCNETVQSGCPWKSNTSNCTVQGWPQVCL